MVLNAIPEKNMEFGRQQKKKTNNHNLSALWSAVVNCLNRNEKKEAARHILSTRLKVEAPLDGACFKLGSASSKDTSTTRSQRLLPRALFSFNLRAESSRVESRRAAVTYVGKNCVWQTTWGPWARALLWFAAHSTCHRLPCAHIAQQSSLTAMWIFGMRKQ